MAYFAEIDINNKVIGVLVVDNKNLEDANGVEVEQIGIDYLEGLTGRTNWVQTDIDGSIRKNYASVGSTFDADLDGFVTTQPYASWVLDTITCRWIPPTAKPVDGKDYKWDEVVPGWVEDLL
jgi:hypothetical protein